MTDEDWAPVQQGLIGKKVVGHERKMAVAPGIPEKEFVNGLIMEVFNLFISRKMQFDKRDLPPMDLGVRYKKGELLFVYSISGGSLFLLALACRKGHAVEDIRLVLAPPAAASSQEGADVKALLSGIRSPYAPSR